MAGFGDVERLRRARRIVIRSKGGDGQAGFARIAVLVDRVLAQRPAAGIVQRVIVVAIDLRIEIGILADIKTAIRGAQPIAQITEHVIGAFAIARVMPPRRGLTVGAQIDRLDRHDLFEMRRHPIGLIGILIDAAPDRIDQLEALIERGAGALFRRRVPIGGAVHRIAHRVGIDVFIAAAPAGIFRIETGVEIAFETGALRFGDMTDGLRGLKRRDGLRRRLQRADQHRRRRASPRNSPKASRVRCHRWRR